MSARRLIAPSLLTEFALHRKTDAQNAILHREACPPSAVPEAARVYPYIVEAFGDHEAHEGLLGKPLPVRI